MRKQGVAALAVLALGAAAMPLMARADLVESYDESTTDYDTTFACGASYGDDVYVDSCGWVNDDDGDGSPDSAYVGAYRETCETQGSFTKCWYEVGSAEVDLSDVVIDREAGTATVTGAIDSCLVSFSLAGTGDGFSSSGGFFDLPGVNARDLSVVVERGWQYSFDAEDATGGGSVCDWFDGPFDSAAIGNDTSSSYERGFRLNPEEAPVVGGGIEHGERPAGSGAVDTVCADWYDSNAEAYSYAYVCGSAFDEGGDGSVESVSVDRYRESCAEMCTGESVYWSGDGSTMAVDADVDGLTGSIVGDADGCAISVTVTGDDSYGGDYSYGYDAIGPGSDPLEVRLGYTEDGSYAAAYGEPDGGAVVCDWTEPADASGGWGGVSESSGETSEHYLRVNPAGIG